VLSLGAKPRGLKPGNNILILSQKICALYVFNLSPFGRTCDSQMVGGTHAEGGMQSHGGQVSTLAHAMKS
jgi:hypothetical protein